MVPFSDLPTNLGNRSSRFPHSHRHDYHGIIPKTSRLRDTHSEGKVKPQISPLRFAPVEMTKGRVVMAQSKGLRSLQLLRNAVIG